MSSQTRLRPFERMLRRRTLLRWREVVEGAKSAPSAVQRRNLEDARQLRRLLNDYLHIAEDRLALPRIGTNAIIRPEDSDWWWRPEVFRAALASPGMSGFDSGMKLGSEATLFHDSILRELTLRQVRNTRETDLAPYGLRLEVFEFDGSFLSLVFDLPGESLTDLSRRHIVRMSCMLETESPLEIYARLNVQHGPNCEQINTKLVQDTNEVAVEFDLGTTEFSEKRTERMWIDLIFENPQMNQITIRDMSFSRQPRAQL